MLEKNKAKQILKSNLFYKYINFRATIDKENK